MSDKKIMMSLEDIMGERFGRYSKYIIQDRALPDVRDGLKPVQRRILYAMYKEGNLYSKAYRKSAKTVGNVIGNYHPHGDTSVYEALVRMSQDWKMRMPLIDMQGNNGSIDNDPAAAMRYTEARLSKISETLLQDIDKETVSMALNFDDTEYEPTVLPAKFPNLLVNGATGISAGYATDIPPHNLHEVIDATIYRIKHQHCSLEDVMVYIKGPDFPTGAIVEGKQGVIDAFTKGRGKVVVRSKVDIVESKTNQSIVITEIPYEVNKADLVRKIDEIRFNKAIDGLIEVRDESDRNGLRIVVDVKKDISIKNTLNYLYKNTDLQKNYNYNMVAIKDKRPTLLGLLSILDAYIAHQEDVVTKRSMFNLNKAQSRLHIVEGLMKAISILDDVVYTIRHSKDKADAKKNLILQYDFTEKQAEAIVMLQLYRLTNTDIVALEEETQDLMHQVEELEAILGSSQRLRKVIIEELENVKKQFASPRLTKIEDEIKDIVIDTEAMIANEDVYVSITQDGYIKRISQRSYKARGNWAFGKKENDYLLSLMEANTLNKLLLFTSQGNYLYIPVHKIEEFRWKDAGKHVSYLVKLNSQEKIVKAILVEDFTQDVSIALVSKGGQIKRTSLKEFEVTRYSKAMKCMTLKNEDSLCDVCVLDGHQAIILVSKLGYATLYSEEEISLIGIKAAGVKGMNLKNDEIISMVHFDPDKATSIVLFNDQGGLKRLHISDIPYCQRATKGTLLFKKLKTKEVYLTKAILADPKDVYNVYLQNGQQYEIAVKDYHYLDLQAGFSTYGKINVGDIQYIDDDHILKIGKNMKPVELEEVVEPTIHIYNERPQNIHYEKLSFEDFLEDFNDEDIEE